MSKKELYELRTRLINSEKYKMIVLEGSTDDYINLDVLYNDHSYLKENIIYSHKPFHDETAVKFLENSREQLIRILEENNILYDSIEVVICPVFFMKESNIINDVDIDYNIKKVDFNPNMLIDNNLVSIRLSLSVKLDNKEITSSDIINQFINKISKAKFLVDYNCFARYLALNGFPIEEFSYDALIKSQINNKQAIINLDFDKEKTFIS